MAAKGKKETKGKEVDEVALEAINNAPISTKAEMKTFLISVRDRLMNNSAPPIFGMAAMNHVLQHADLYELVDSSNREVLQEIWVKLSQAGMHLRKPPLLFTEVADGKA